MLIDGKKCKNFVLYFLSTISAAICCTCLAIRTYEFFRDNLSFFEVLSMSFIMCQGSADNLAPSIDAKDIDPNKIINFGSQQAQSAETTTTETMNDTIHTLVELLEERKEGWRVGDLRELEPIVVSLTGAKVIYTHIRGSIDHL